MNALEERVLAAVRGRRRTDTVQDIADDLGESEGSVALALVALMIEGELKAPAKRVMDDDPW